MANDEMLHIEVVYALPHEQQVFKVMARASTSVAEIIQSSGVLEAYPEIDLTQNKVGVYSRQVKLDGTVMNGDRIEIYRPLIADPKEIRRRRAEKAAAATKK